MRRFFPINRLASAFIRARAGTAGTEFAIAAPVVLLAIIAMTDIGLAIGRQIALDQSVRAGAEFAMGGVDDTSRVEDIVFAAATGYGKDTVQDDGPDAGEKGPTVDVTEVCRCPGSAVEVSCSAKTCSGDDPSRFFSISASQAYDPLFIHKLNLSSSVQVQVQ